MNMKSNHIFFERWFSCALFLVLHRILLDYLYFNYVAIHFGYAGLVDAREEDLFVVSWVLFMIPLAFLRFWLKKNFGSVNVIFFIYLLSYIPFTTCVYAGIISNECIAGNFMFFIILFILHWLVCKLPAKGTILLKIGKFHIDEKILFFVAFLMVLVNLYVSYRYTGFRLLFDLSDVYGIRAESSGYRLPPLFGYIFSMSNAILPFLIGYCMIRKHFVFAVILWGVEYIHFGIDGSKTVFFMPVFIILIVLCLRKFSVAQFKVSSIYCLLVMEIGGLFESFMFPVSIIIDRFIRRMFFLPNRLHEAYYQFFTLHEPDYFYGSFLRHLGLHSAYRDLGGIPKAIGIFLGTPSQYANNGLFSDAMANFGLLGVVIMPILLVAVLRFFDKCTIGLDRSLIIAAAFQISLSIHSTALGTAMLSGGILLLILFCRLCPRESYIAKDSEERLS